MKKTVIFSTFLLFSGLLWSQEKLEHTLGLYAGGGFRKYDAFYGWKYNAGYGVESGMTYRMPMGKYFRMIYNLGITYDYFDAEENNEYRDDHVWHKMTGLELLVRPEFRLIRRRWFSLYIGAGMNIDRFVSYFVKYTSVYYDPYEVHAKDWQHIGYREETYFGFNAGISADFKLSERLKLSLDASLVSRLRIDFSSSSQYTGQNLRLSIVGVL